MLARESWLYLTVSITHSTINSDCTPHAVPGLPCSTPGSTSLAADTSLWFSVYTSLAPDNAPEFPRGLKRGGGTHPFSGNLPALPKFSTLHVAGNMKQLTLLTDHCFHFTFLKFHSSSKRTSFPRENSPRLGLAGEVLSEPKVPWSQETRRLERRGGGLLRRAPSIKR